ncbi:hypothetical protein Efla_003376 [Eimeria flavescens]
MTDMSDGEKQGGARARSARRARGDALGARDETRAQIARTAVQHVEQPLAAAGTQQEVLEGFTPLRH